LPKRNSTPSFWMVQLSAPRVLGPLLYIWCPRRSTVGVPAETIERWTPIPFQTAIISGTCWKHSTSSSSRTLSLSRLPVETRQVLTTAIGPPGFHSTIHDRQTTHIRTGQCCRRRSLASIPSLRHHPSKHWPKHKTTRPNFEHCSRRTPPYG
jgi:hypothetical protein